MANALTKGLHVVNPMLYEKVSKGISEDDYNNNLGYNLVVIKPNMEKNWGWADTGGGIKQQIQEKYPELLSPVVGVMQNEFNYSLSSQWDTIDLPAVFDGTIVGAGLQLANEVSYMAGGGELGSVYRSKKMWKKSGDLTITPEIRVIDVDGTGLPLNAAFKCLVYATSLGSKQFVPEKIMKFLDAAGDTIQNASATGVGIVGKYLSRAAGDPSSDTFSAFYGIVNGVVDNIREDMDDMTKLRATPPPLDIQIGKFFRHDDMVCTDVNFNFSKQCSASGPLWVDIRLTFVTRTIISSIDETGLWNSVQNLNNSKRIGSGISVTKDDNKPSQINQQSDGVRGITDAEGDTKKERASHTGRREPKSMIGSHGGSNPNY